MAKSFEEALKKAGVTKDTVRKANADEIARPKLAQVSSNKNLGRKEPEPSFADLIGTQNLVVTKSTNVQPHKWAAPSPGRVAVASDPVRQIAKQNMPSKNANAMVAKSVTAEREELKRYLATINRSYHQKRPDAPLKDHAKVQQKSLPILELKGELIPNPLLIADMGLDVPMLKLSHNGIAQQLDTPHVDSGEIDLTIGLDFGTSSAKVVIRDSIRRAFAIPYFSESEDNPYLLPSRLYEFNGVYQLTGGGVAHRDLKICLLHDTPSQEEFERAAAFLALVIRHCRGWLLSEKADVYRHAQLNWFLNLGLPAASYQDLKFVARFRTLALAAINLANSTEKIITVSSTKAYCDWALKEIREEAEGFQGNVTPTVKVDMVDIVPEVSAQVYGYVQSSRFDVHAANNYMLIDIGAGTVDASIFNVRQEAGGKVGFTLYANNVKPNGVMNLHRVRLAWLSEIFASFAPMGSNANRTLQEVARPTDRLNPIPDRLVDYFEGVQLNFSPEIEDPDERFFVDRYRRQVFKDTLSFVRGKKLRGADLFGLPTFITGGGARMAFFGGLADAINFNSGTNWARLNFRTLEAPKELIAPGLKNGEYDRLSVAYGLSFIRLGTYVKTLAVPDIPPPPTRDDDSRFISKDQV